MEILLLLPRFSDAGDPSPHSPLTFSLGLLLLLTRYIHIFKAYILKVYIHKEKRILKEDGK